MIVKVTTVNQVQKILRLSLCKGEIYMSLKDVVDIAAFEDRLRINDGEIIKKIAIIVGEDNFKLIYFTDNFNPLYVKRSLYEPFISYNGLEKLIDYPELDDYLIKLDLVRIDNFINKDKKVILETLSSEEFNKDMYVVQKTSKKENNQSYEKGKENNMNEMKLFRAAIGKDICNIHYFKSKNEKLWFSLKDLSEFIEKYSSNLSYNNILDFIKDEEFIGCKGKYFYETSENELVYVNDEDYVTIFVRYPTIDKLIYKLIEKKYFDDNGVEKLNLLKYSLCTAFEEIGIELTEEEIETRIEALRKEIDKLWGLRKSIIKNKEK